MPGQTIAVIVGGGHGECLRLGEDYVPKVLLPVAEKPLLDHQIEWLKSAGFEEITLCLGYKADLVRARFGDGSRNGVRLRYSVEESPLGTAGAVRALGPASLPEDILVLYGDVLPRTDLRKMLEFHRSHQAMGTLALHDCGLEGRHKECRRACLGPSRVIVDMPENPDSGPGVSVSPLWIVRRGLLHHVGEAPPSDFLADVFPAAVKKGEKLVGYLESGALVDIGSAEKYREFAGRARKKAKGARA